MDSYSKCSELDKALTAWRKWFSAKLDRISVEHNKGLKATEDYSGYEMDLLEAIYKAMNDG